ncbi:RagB/SusD family nutrient uptake outer membrane protein [Pseudoflavitalea rhizosphaerae]|uniref:RagB/SusD family nutrient uptake outer membrane protein n=1 Tax=Pseudoflavitalea rhizosphaerae TaxID=1884793 RepID=UPI000F8DEB76|nr:RagB/SusD family nutrient uptake outer membrane protein [Pseudoflavitalea rhizosphaerae]
MQKVNVKYIILHLLLLSAVFTGCSKDYSNPNAALANDVFESDRAATAAAVGIQRQYSTSAAGSLYAIINANGFVSKEFDLRNAGNIGELQLFTGGSAVDATNNVITNIWTNSAKVIFEADNVLNYAKEMGDKSYSAGLISYASIFKALALGNLGMFWEQVPDTVGVQNANFISRIDGFKKAIAILDEGIAAYNATPLNSTIKSRLPGDVDLINTMYALKARFALYSGDYATALAAADQVDLTKKSVFSYNSLAFNPVFESATSTNNVFQPVDSTLGLPPAIAPDEDDQRIPFHTRVATNPKWRIGGFFINSTSSVPIYTPGEVMLIKAEAYTRQATPDLGKAVAELNKVLTKTAATDPFGVGADLPAIVGTPDKTTLLREIYRNRSIELFMSGLKLEDMRRFSGDLPPSLTDRKRNYFPFPFRERDNNTNTPADPAG